MTPCACATCANRRAKDAGLAEAGYTVLDVGGTRACESCGHLVRVGEWPWCPHGTPSFTHIPDEIPGGMTVENMGPTPLTFYSKSEWRREMKARGLVNQVRHVGVQGSDKSPHTSRWV